MTRSLSKSRSSQDVYKLYIKELRQQYPYALKNFKSSRWKASSNGNILGDTFCRGDYFIYYTHFEMTGGPCNLIGSNWCDLFTNCTIFLLYEEATLKTKQPIRLQGLFKVTDQIAGRWKTWSIMWQILQLLFPKLLFFPPKKWINLIWNWLSIVVTKYLKSCIWAISKWM